MSMHGGTYPRTLAFEVLNFTHENGWNKKKIIGFHKIKRTPKFLYSWFFFEIKLAKHLGPSLGYGRTGFFPIIMSNDPCKNKFNHASAKSVPTFGRACVLYGELHVKWTCVIFRTRQFSISKWAAENIFFYRGLLIKSVRTSSWISVLSFARAKNILCACPTVGSVRGWVPWWYLDLIRAQVINKLVFNTTIFGEEQLQNTPTLSRNGFLACMPTPKF